MKNLIKTKSIILTTIFGIALVFQGCEKEGGNDLTSQLSDKKTNPLTTKSLSVTVTINTESEEELDAQMETSNYTYKLNASIINETNISNLTILEEGTIVYEHEFIHDLSLEFPRLFVRNEIVSDANSISLTLNLTDAELDFISKELPNAASALRKEMNPYNQLAEIGQAIFYHTSMLKMMNRKREQSQNECTCWTHIPYLQGESSFACTEDIVMNTSELNNILIENHDTTEVDSIGIDSVIRYTGNNPSIEITQYQVHQMMMADEPDQWEVDTISYSPRLLFCFFLDGSDLGCCGNYSGPCWYCHVLCLMHDIVCYCCDSDLCLGGCKPEEGCP